MRPITIAVIAIYLCGATAHASDFTDRDATEVARGYAEHILHGNAEGIFSHWHPRFTAEIGGGEEALASISDVYGSGNPLSKFRTEVRLSPPQLATFLYSGTRESLYVIKYSMRTRGFPEDVVRESLLVLQPYRDQKSAALRVFDVSCWTIESLPSYFDEFRWVPVDETRPSNSIVIRRNGLQTTGL